MATKLKVLIDLDILLDVLQRREPFYEKSAQVLASAELRSIEGHVAAHNLTTLFYLVARYLGAEQAQLALLQLLIFLFVAPVDQAVIERALVLSFTDFGEAVVMMAAVQAGADYVVSRDTQGFKRGPLPALTPAELLSIIQETDEDPNR
jgi:predicted nucleic acid-binding protein